MIVSRIFCGLFLLNTFNKFNIQGSPEPEIIWFKDNKPLKDDYRVDIYNDRGIRYLEICGNFLNYFVYFTKLSHLFHVDVQLNDSGEYTIFLRNISNQVHAITQVNIVENLNKVKKSKTEGLFFYESKLVSSF